MSVMTQAVRTAPTKARHPRIAPLYDRLEAMSEKRFRPWREKLWNQTCGDTPSRLRHRQEPRLLPARHTHHWDPPGGSNAQARSGTGALGMSVDLREGESSFTATPRRHRPALAHCALHQTNYSSGAAWRAHYGDGS